MERYDTKDHFHAWYEHWHRYHWLTPYVQDKTVADLACGEGYGSALLAQFAKQVLAIDIDQATIERASNKYQNHENLNYIQADVLNTPIDQQSIDCLVSFETLEHLSQHCQLLAEFKRVLRTNGLLVLSTPDKDVYSGSEHHNEFHVKELNKAEFTELVEHHFKHVVYFGQQLQTNSVLAPLDQSSGSNLEALYVEKTQEQTTQKNQCKPTYLIAVASDSIEAIQPFLESGSSYFNDVNNSLFAHYDKQVADLIATDQRLIDADQRLLAMELQLQQQRAVISQLQARLGL